MAVSNIRRKRGPYKIGMYPTKLEVVREARKHLTRSKFKSSSKVAYEKARIGGYLDEACSHMAVQGNSANKFVYIARDSKSVYVGITYSLKQRLKKGRHKALDLMDSDMSVYVTPSPLPLKAALRVERRLISEFRKSTYPLKCLNKSNGGEAGFSGSKWHLENISKEAIKYSSRREFSDGSSSAYNASGRLGIRDKVCAHMKPKRLPSGYWRDEKNIIEFAKSCGSRNQFCKNIPAVKGMRALNIESQVYSILPKAKCESWSAEMVLEMALKYETKLLMLRGNSSLAQAANRLGIYEEATSHMICHWEYKKRLKRQGTVTQP